jgi:hypothetical protein
VIEQAVGVYDVEALGYGGLERNGVGTEDAAA